MAILNLLIGKNNQRAWVYTLILTRYLSHVITFLYAIPIFLAMLVPLATNRVREGMTVEWLILSVFIAIGLGLYFGVLWGKPRLTKKWRYQSRLTQDECYKLVQFGKTVVALLDKEFDWPMIRNITPNGHTTARATPQDHISDHARALGKKYYCAELIGAVLYAYVKECGWSSLTKDAYLYFLLNPKAWRSFAWMY